MARDLFSLPMAPGGYARVRTRAFQATKRWAPRCQPVRSHTDAWASRAGLAGPPENRHQTRITQGRDVLVIPALRAFG